MNKFQITEKLFIFLFIGKYFFFPPNNYFYFVQQSICLVSALFEFPKFLI